MPTDPSTEEPAGALDLEDLLSDLDAILDAWFLGEVRPALEQAERARRAPDIEAA